MGVAGHRAQGFGQLPRRVAETAPGKLASTVKRWLKQRAIGLRLELELPGELAAEGARHD
jgi:hypothetical protein